MFGRRGVQAFGVAACAAAVVSIGNPAAAAVAGTANVGSADVTFNGQPGSIAPLAPCDVNGAKQGSTPGATIPGVATFGAGTTKCDFDAASSTSSMSANGQDFVLNALTPYGGPEIGIGGYDASCKGMKDRGSGSFNVSAFHGVDLPEQLPANYTVTIPGRNQGDPPMAKLVFGEVIQPPVHDGSLRVNTLHVTLFPNGGPASGDLYVGSVYCTLTR